MNKLFLLLLIALSLFAPATQAAKLEDLLDRKAVQKKIRDSIADQDINFGIDLGNVDILQGIGLSSNYEYEVEASYINKFYTRVDKWNLNANVNIGDVLKDLIDVPFGFTMNKTNSVLFVRQFPSKIEAIKALPYAPNKLPLNSTLALRNLRAGDFVSMPANLSIAVGVGAATSYVSPMIVNANVNASFVLSGEFTVQVFKLDETHVRLKLITKRGRDSSTGLGVNADFNFFGINLLNKEINHLLERDLAQLGFSYNPGSQFIVDYVFDLKDPEAQLAYDQILSSTFKFKDLLVADMIDAKDLKDKLISSYEKAEELAFSDLNLPVKEKRVQRIFKGFTNYSGHNRHLKFSFLMAGYSKDRSFTDSKITYIDPNENQMEFYYPTFSKFIESHLGKSIFELKDQTFQNNFGLIPRYNLELTKEKYPDLGLTFERKDRRFTPYEQLDVERFMLTQIPTSLAKDIDLSEWRDGTKKTDTRIFFQLILKSQGFNYLKNLDAEFLKKKIIEYVTEKRKLHVITDTTNSLALVNLKNFLLLNRFIEKEKLLMLADSLATILKNENNDSEDMLKKLVALNEFGVFDKVGVGFLISLLPQDKLSELVYLKLEMIGKDIRPINTEIGNLNYKELYKELNEVQSRLSNRSYDLRLSTLEEKGLDPLLVH